MPVKGTKLEEWLLLKQLEEAITTREVVLAPFNLCDKVDTDLGVVIVES